jgi:hypothetical protein
MKDYKSIFPPKEYGRIILCVALFCYLLLCYNGLWNMALYPTEAKYTETISSFMGICLMLTPATLIAATFGALSVLELVCTVEDSEWKTIMEMILWTLLTILMNSFTAYLISLGNNAVMGIWMILITTSVVNIIWYISTIILFKSSKSLHELAKKLEDKDTIQNEDVTYMEETISTRQLALRTIEKIGSSPEESEDGRIQFEYQGVIFLMEVADECLFVNLIWPWCHSFSKFDIDEFARVRQVVNEVNLHDWLSVIYTITDSDDVALHIKRNIILIPQIPDVEKYLKQILNSFFRVARTLDLEIEKCRMQECEQQI